MRHEIYPQIPRLRLAWIDNEELKVDLPGGQRS